MLFDPEGGAATREQLARLRGLGVRGVIVGPIISGELLPHLSSMSPTYEVRWRRERIRLTAPLSPAEEAERLVEFARGELGAELVGARLMAATYPEWMSLLEAAPRGADFLELDFSIPLLLCGRSAAERVIISEVVGDAASMLSVPVAVRLSFLTPGLRETLSHLSGLGVEFIALSVTYVSYRLVRRGGAALSMPSLCRDSALNDLLVSLVKPWSAEGVPLALSTEVSGSEVAGELLGYGFRVLEVGLSLILAAALGEPLRGVALPPAKVKEAAPTRPPARAAPIISERCDRCGGRHLCVRLCPEGALAVGPDGLPVLTKVCSGCGLCLSVCPRGAIEMAYQVEVEEVE
mgnify:CR=1 FL=1